MKRALSVLLAVGILLSIVPTLALPVSAATRYAYDEYFTYVINDATNEAVVNNLKATPTGDIVIPATIDGAKVVEIAERLMLRTATGGYSGVTSVTLPDSIHTIGASAFENLSGMTSIKLPAELTEIKTDTFAMCTSLKSIVIGDKVKKIGDNAFLACTSLESVTMGKGVTFIGTSFYNVPKLKKIYISDLAAWCQITSYNEAYHPMSFADELYLNDKLLTKVTVPSNVKTLTRRSLSSSKITSVTIPNTVTTIERGALYGASGLQELTMPYLGKNVDDTQYDFLNYIFGALDTGRPNLFVPAPLKKVTVTSAKHIGGTAFINQTNLQTVILNKGITEIGNQAFSGCTSLTAITIPGTVTTLGQNIFYNCTALKSAVIENGVTAIGPTMFYYCTALEDLYLPGTLTSVGGYAFIGCTKLKNVYFCGTSAQKASISMDIGSEYLLGTPGYSNAKWQMHKYANDCDSTCDICSKKRSVSHTYSNSCDTSCNVCKATRKTSHSYKTVTKAATLTKNGSVTKKCACGKVASTTTIKYAKTIKLSATSYTYDGKAKKPSVTVKDSAGKTISSKYYTVTYASGRKNVGTYKVTIKFKGNYSGTKTLTFKINPPKTAVSKLSGAKKSFKVTVSKKSSQVTGYEVQYATSKAFKSAKTKTIKSYKTTALTVKSLSAKKTYYVRVRTYKTVSGKKYYSGWSSVKSTKTK